MFKEDMEKICGPEVAPYIGGAIQRIVMDPPAVLLRS